MRDTVTDEVVATAAGLAPLITAASEEGEAARCTPRRVIGELVNTALFQTFLLRALGGSEPPPLVAFRADWCSRRAWRQSDRQTLANTIEHAGG